MKKVIGSPFFSFLLALILVAATYLTCGIYFEESMKFEGPVIYGQISAPPVNAWFSESLLFQPPILAALSSIFKSLPIVGIWHFLLVVIYVHLLLHLCIRVCSRWISSTLWVVVSSVLCCFAFAGTSLIYLHLGREAILLMALSLMLYLDYYVYDQKQPFFLMITFLLGCMMRSSLGIFVLPVLGILASLHFQSLRRALKLYWLPTLMVITCFGITVLYKFSGGNAGVVIEQNYEYALMDRGAIVPISNMKSANDSVRYEALTRFFFITDSARINLDFIRQVVDTKKFTSLSLGQDDWTHMLDTLIPILRSLYYPLLLLYLLLLLSLWRCSRKTLIHIIILNGICWIVIIVLSMKISMYDRFFIPWTSVMFIGSFLLISYQNIRLRLLQKCIMLILVITLCFWTGGQIKDISASEQVYNRSAAIYLKNLEALSETQIPIIWDYSQCYFPTGIFTRDETQVMNKCIYQTEFYIAYFPFGQQRCIEKIGASPLDWRAMGRIFIKRRGEISFIMKDQVAEFLPRYYETMYGIKFILEKDAPEKEISPGNFVYHLKLSE